MAVKAKHKTPHGPTRHTTWTTISQNPGGGGGLGGGGAYKDSPPPPPYASGHRSRIAPLPSPQMPNLPTTTNQSVQRWTPVWTSGPSAVVRGEQGTSMA